MGHYRTLPPHFPNVRSTTESGHRRKRSSCPPSAKSRLMNRSKNHRQSSRSRSAIRFQTGVAQRKWFARAVSPDHERLLQQHRRDKLATAHLLARQRTIPESEQHQRVGALLLKWRIFRHWTGENTARVSSFQSERHLGLSRCTTFTLYPDFRSRLPTSSAIITERCCPPVHPNEIVR